MNREEYVRQKMIFNTHWQEFEKLAQDYSFYGLLWRVWLSALGETTDVAAELECMETIPAPPQAYLYVVEQANESHI